MDPAWEWCCGKKHIQNEIRTRSMAARFLHILGMPVCRPLGDGLFEVRSNIKDGIARVLFCIHEGKMVLHRCLTKGTDGLVRPPASGLAEV